MIRGVLFFLGTVLLLAQVFALGYLIGAGRGMELVRREAVAEGYAVRDGEGIRWKSSDELQRKPARRDHE